MVSLPWNSVVQADGKECWLLFALFLIAVGALWVSANDDFRGYRGGDEWSAGGAANNALPVGKKPNRSRSLNGERGRGLFWPMAPALCQPFSLPLGCVLAPGSLPDPFLVLF